MLTQPAKPTSPKLVPQPTTLEQFKTSLSKYAGGGTLTLITQPPLYKLAKRLLGMSSFTDMLDEIYKHALEFCSLHRSGMPIDRKFASILEEHPILCQDQSQRPEDILFFANILIPCVGSLLASNTPTITALAELMPIFSRQQRKATLIYLKWHGVREWPSSLMASRMSFIRELKRQWYPTEVETQDMPYLTAKREQKFLLATETKHAADTATNSIEPQALIHWLRQQLDVQTNDTRTRFKAISSLAFINFTTPPTPTQAGEIIDILVKQFHCEDELCVEVRKIKETQTRQSPAVETLIEFSARTELNARQHWHQIVTYTLLSALVELPFVIPNSHEQMFVDMVVAGLSNSDPNVAAHAWEILKELPYSNLTSQQKRLIDTVLALINKDIDKGKITETQVANLKLFYPLLTQEDPQKEAIFKRLMGVYTIDVTPSDPRSTLDNAFEVLRSIFPSLPVALKTLYVQAVIKIFEHKDFVKFYPLTLNKIINDLTTADNGTISLPDQAKLMREFLEYCFTFRMSDQMPRVLELVKLLPLFSQGDVRSIASLVFRQLAHPRALTENYTVTLLPPIYAALPSGELSDSDEIKLEDLAAYQAGRLVETSSPLSDEDWDFFEINSQRELRAALLQKITDSTDASIGLAKRALVGIAITMNQQQFVALVDELERLSDRLTSVVDFDDPRSQNRRMKAQADIRETIYGLYKAQPTFVNSQQADKISSSIWPHLRYAIKTKFDLEESIKQLNERINEYDNRDQNEAAPAAAEIERRHRFEHEIAIEKLTISRRFIKCSLATLIVLLAKVPLKKQDPIMLEILESMSVPDEEIALHVLEIIEDSSFYFPQPQKSRLANALMTKLQTSLSNDQRAATINALVAIYPAESDTLEPFYATLIKELQAVSKKDVWVAAALRLADNSHLMSQMQETAYVKQLMSSLAQDSVDSEVEFTAMRIMLICFPYQLSSADRGKFFVKICGISKWITAGLGDGIDATSFLENLISYLTEIPQEDLVTLAQHPGEILQFTQRVPPEYTAQVHDLFPKMFAALPSELVLSQPQENSSSPNLTSKKRKRTEEVLDTEEKLENNGSDTQLPPTNGVMQTTLPPKLRLFENLLELLEDKSNATRDAAYDALAKIVSQVDVTWQNQFKERLCLHFEQAKSNEGRLSVFKLLGIIYSAQQTQACLTGLVPKDVEHIVTSYMFPSSLQP